MILNDFDKHITTKEMNYNAVQNFRDELNKCHRAIIQFLNSQRIHEMIVVRMIPYLARDSVKLQSQGPSKGIQEKEIKTISLMCIDILEQCSKIGFNAEEMLRNELNERHRNAK